MVASSTAERAAANPQFRNSRTCFSMSTAIMITRPPPAEIILDIRRQGVTVLIVEQNARMALELADRAYILEDGRIVHEGPTEALRRDPAVMTRHLVV